MKVQTLEYNANQPMPQQIAVPTNSVYAVGVKVIKDGEVIDGDLSVDGVSASTKIADYKIVQLSSESAETMKALDVVIDCQSTVESILSGQAEKMSSAPMAIKNNVTLVALSATPLSSLETLPASYVTKFDASYVLSSASGVTDPVDVGRDNKTLTINVNNLYILDNDKWWNPQTGVITDEVAIDSTTVLQARQITANAQNIIVDYNFTVDSQDSFNSKFPLQVMQKDMGYIEIA